MSTKLYGYLTNNNNLNDVALNDDWAVPSLVLSIYSMGRTLPYLPYLPYLKDIWYGRDLLFHKPFNLMTREEFKNYGALGDKYYQNFLQNNPINKRGFGLIEFGRKNRNKDITVNKENYPFLRKNINDAVENLEPTNNKNEPDRIYHYLENRNNGNLYHYLIEDIKNKGFKYKMMKNKTKGE